MLKRLASIFGHSSHGSPRVHAGVFGKHPGWDDHIDDLGLSTPRLADVKRALYAEAIAGNIDAGRWEQLPNEQRLGRIDHFFVWRFGAGEAVLGRVWASRDGKGRDKYPMVLAVHCQDTPLDVMRTRLTPMVLAAADELIASPDAATVRARLAMQETMLRTAAGAGVGGAAVGGAGEQDDGIVHESLLRELCGFLSGESVMRVLYAVEREMKFYLAKGRAGRSSRKTTAVMDNRARHLRMTLPRAMVGRPGEAAWACGALVLEGLGYGKHGIEAGVLAIEPLEAGQRRWIDVIVGRPSAAELFCLRAGPSAVGLVSEVPYTMDAEFVAWAQAKINAWGGGSFADVPPGESGKDGA